MGSRITVSIGDLGEVVGGATPSTKFGSYWDGDIPWLSPKDLTGYAYRYISQGARNITKIGFDSCSTKMLPEGTVLFSSRAPIGYVAIASNPICTNQGFKSVVPNEKTNSLFLYYLLKANRDFIELNGSGTTFKEVSGKTLSSIEVTIPSSKEEQAAIASVLGSIDDKIELNSRLNDYLAELCEVVAGKYCEAGDACLNDICHQVTERRDCGDSDLATYVSTESLLQNKQGRQTASSLPVTGKVTCYRAGDTLLSNIRPYFKKIWYAPFDGTCSGDVLVFRAKEDSMAPYLHACLRQDRFFDHVMRGAKGTKMPRGDKKQMMEFVVSLKCDPEDLAVLNAATMQIAANASENEQLAELRDALLPKLMSGEIDVSKVDLG